MHDVMSEVLKVYPLLELKVDDMKIHVWRNTQEVLQQDQKCFPRSNVDVIADR